MIVLPACVAPPLLLFVVQCLRGGADGKLPRPPERPAPPLNTTPAPRLRRPQPQWQSMLALV